MRRGFGWLPLGVALSGFLLGCTGRAEAVRAAQPYIENFGELRSRALSLLELRADVERRRLLAKALAGDEGSLPENLKPMLERMRAEGAEVTAQQLQHGETLFWRMLDYTFSENPNVLQAEILYLEKDGSVDSLRHPREREIPVGLKWHGLREHRTFAALTNCVTEFGSEPCVLLQLRPRDYPGSAGLTVAYRRTPIDVTAE
jgi:hypothetical protein